MTQRESFVFYRSFLLAVEQAPIEEQLLIYKCIFRYALDGVEPDQDNLSTIGKVIWMMAKPQLDKNWKRYLNALKGGAPKGARNNPNGRRGTNQEQTENKPNDNVNVNDNDNESSEEDIKESSNEPKKDVSLDPPLSQGLESFHKWLESKCPYIYKHLTFPTETEFEKLLQSYTKEEIAEVCEQIENRSDLRKTYTNLYRTLLNWLKRNHQRLKS